MGRAEIEYVYSHASPEYCNLLFVHKFTGVFVVLCGHNWHVCALNASQRSVVNTHLRKPRSGKASLR